MDGTETNGFTTGIEMGTQLAGQPTDSTDPYASPWASLTYSKTTEVLRGDKLYLDFWQKLVRLRVTSNIYLYYGILKIFIQSIDEDGVTTNHYLANKEYFPVSNDNPESSPIELEWTIDNVFLMAAARPKTGYDYNNQYIWEHCIYDIPECPAGGRLYFSIHGLASNRGKSTENFPGFQLNVGNFTSALAQKRLRTVRDGFVDEGGSIPRYQITGVFLGFIPEDNELAQQQDFIYENKTGVYTLEKSPIAVYNGDVQDEKHISNIIVPTNVSGKKNFWNTIDDLYSLSSIGLITVKSIMNQYFEPKRIIEGTIKQDNLTFNTRYEFDFLPDLKFILQRGSFNRKVGYLEDAMFVQITENELPQGGTEGGNTNLEDLQQTGRTRCQKDGSNLNTGYIEVELTDVNINSPTYGQNQWIVFEEFPDVCPIGEPNYYYWGADFTSYDVNNLTSIGYEEDTDEVQCPFNNDGTGKYLFFIHIDTLGLVDGVETVDQPEIISDWNYLSDTIIDGFNYKVLRMNYITAEYYDFSIIFKFA
jgi:hypothetical protein